MDTSSLSFRKEVLSFLQSCDDLLATISKANGFLLSNEELEVLEYSVLELQKVLYATEALLKPEVSPSLPLGYNL
jgi:hypothetical protein